MHLSLSPLLATRPSSDLSFALEEEGLVGRVAPHAWLGGDGRARRKSAGDRRRPSRPSREDPRGRGVRDSRRRGRIRAVEPRGGGRGRAYVWTPVTVGYSM